MTNAEKKAVATAYDYFKHPGEYPMVTNNNSEEKNAVIAGVIDAFFEIDDDGNVIEISKETVEKFNKIALMKGVKNI